MTFSEFSRSNLLLVLALWLAAAIGFALVPLNASVPVHWNFHGQPDLFVPGWLSLLLLPAVGLFVLLVLTGMRRVTPERNVEPGLHIAHIGLNAVFCMLLVMQVVFIVLGRGGEVVVPMIVSLCVGGLLVAVGNALPKSQPNAIAGLRLPWTLKDGDNWTTTHRWTGRMMMVAGLALMALALTLLQGAGYLVALLVATFAPLLAGSVLSFWISRRKAGEG